MVKQKKKGTSGEAKRYITRTAALRKLQLPLPNFRRLCILKGIYPREPNNRKKAQKGDTRTKTLYLAKDIRFLLHEPIVWKFREHRAVMRKVKKSYNRNEIEKGASLFNKRPRYSLNHIILERYPTFTDALNDLDDPLTLAFLYTRMPNRIDVKPGVIDTSLRLSTEFLLYVIEAKALRKVFISIKGYYYQVEIMGQTITWIAPHNFAARGGNVDQRIMKTFLEFYLVLIGFVNYRLYTGLGLHYPPELPGSHEDLKKTLKEDAEHLGGSLQELKNRTLASLNVSLMINKKRVNEEDDGGIDMHLLEGMDVKLAEKELENKTRQQKLFEGMKFFLGRETNIESLTFVIRSCSGVVSWDKLTGPGSTYQEDDETITHQIADRPKVTRKYMSRYYIQPQWVYDCLNAQMLLPMQDYFPGAELPPHLSPFENKDEIYVPPEQKLLLARQRGEVLEDEFPKAEEDSDDEAKNDTEVSLPIPKSYHQLQREKRKKWQARVKRRRMDEEARVKDMAAFLNSKPSSDAVEGNSQGTAKETNEQDDDDDNVEVGELQLNVENKEPALMEVTKGKKLSHQGRVYKAEKKAQMRLSIMMLSKRRRKVYWAIKRKEAAQQRKADRLKAKRDVIEKQKEEEKKMQRQKLLKGRAGY